MLTRREPKGMKSLICWICKDFGHLSRKFPKRLRRKIKSFLSNKDEELSNDCKKREVIEKIDLITIVDLEANHESMKVKTKDETPAIE